MKKKVVVYAISKNEEQFVDRWFESVKEADEIYVLDTGSEDQTVKKLKEKGVFVTVKEIVPWRFDTARNLALELVPEDTDICISMDLDEVILKGWREKLEQIWKDDTTRLAYNYNWRLDENNVPLVNFYIEKIHSRKNYKWTHPVHEVLTYTGSGKENIITTNDITVNHYPDGNKSRSNYLPLLELSILEDPHDDRNMHYLGREYMYYGKWEQAIKTLHRHLALSTATWKDERCASMRFISRCYRELGYIEEAKMWLEKARIEAPYLRDPYLESAILSYQLKEWNQVIQYILEALKIKSHQKTYINEPFSWNETPYDLLSIAYFNIGEYDLSLFYCQKALKINPLDTRLQQNLKDIQKKVND